jgi:hypothetical protein
MRAMINVVGAAARTGADGCTKFSCVLMAHDRARAPADQQNFPSIHPPSLNCMVLFIASRAVQSPCENGKDKRKCTASSKWSENEEFFRWGKSKLEREKKESERGGCVHRMCAAHQNKTKELHLLQMMLILK